MYQFVVNVLCFCIICFVLSGQFKKTFNKLCSINAPVLHRPIHFWCHLHIYTSREYNFISIFLCIINTQWNTSHENSIIRITTAIIVRIQISCIVIPTCIWCTLLNFSFNGSHIISTHVRIWETIDAADTSDEAFGIEIEIYQKSLKYKLFIA